MFIQHCFMKIANKIIFVRHNYVAQHKNSILSLFSTVNDYRSSCSTSIINDPLSLAIEKQGKRQHDMLSYYICIPQKNSNLHFTLDSPRHWLVFRVLIRFYYEMQQSQKSANSSLRKYKILLVNRFLYRFHCNWKSNYTRDLGRIYFKVIKVLNYIWCSNSVIR